MALLTQQAPNIQGTAMNYSAVSASDTFSPGDNVYLHVKTGGTNTVTPTVVVPGTQYGQNRPDISTGSLAINSDRIIGPFVADLADPTTGLVTVTHAGTLTGTTCALLQM